MTAITSVWIFHGARGRFAGGVFTTVAAAEAWIGKHALTGVLTEYPVDTGVYEWAVEARHFEPKRDAHREPAFVGSFTTAAMRHYHYEDGVGERDQVTDPLLERRAGHPEE